MTWASARPEHQIWSFPSLEPAQACALVCVAGRTSLVRIVVTYLMSYLYDDPTAKAAWPDPFSVLIFVVLKPNLSRIF